ncbi:MAG: Bifunctional PGK/TIM [Chlamydiia bacterium]|nr:Bifunctional PGK/TIM [Chlamydiia bacterium]
MKLTLEDLELTTPLKGKRVLMRVDFNVPTEDGQISDDTRIRAALFTINYILNAGGRVILMSHFGRPKGKPDPKYTLRPIADRLAELLGKKVQFVDTPISPDLEQLTHEMSDGEVMLLENIRFYPAETDPENDPTFAETLAKLGDIYVNEAFGAAHRKHSSTYTLVPYFDRHACMGFLMEKEVTVLHAMLSHPEKPFMCIIGGSKVSSKIKLLSSLLHRADAIFIGGAMANTFLAAQGHSVGNSLVEEDYFATAKEFRQLANASNTQIYLPTDAIIAPSIDSTETQTISLSDPIPPDQSIFDIGPETITHWKNALEGSKTLFANGTVGAFEHPQFASGTNAIAQLLADSPAITVIGGGDSVSAIKHLGLDARISHISTGGGAALEFIQHATLPALEALPSPPTEEAAEADFL